MKKLLPILILLAFVAFCYQIIVTFFITEHEINYSLIASDQRHYTISEKYQRDGERYYYSFLIKSKNKHYTTAVFNDFNKQDRVITDIKYYKKNNLQCIFPIYKRNHTFDVACLLDNQQVSPFYLLESGNSDFLFISKKFSEEGYDEQYYKLEENITEEENLSIYYEYIPKNYLFAIWNYRGIYIINSDGIENKVFLNEDHYENNLSIVAGKYYVTVNTDDEEEQLNYNQIILYNLQDGGKSLVEVDLSQDSYFNGTFNDKVYITDPKAKVQYVLDPSKKTIQEVNQPKEIINSQLKNADKDFFDSLHVDNNKVNNKKISSLYDITDIKKNGEDYYFKTKDGELYRVIQNDYEHPILLCQFDDIKEWQVHDDGLSFIVDDTLYFYSDIYGVKPVVKNLEFKYNYKNITHFIREE